MTSADERARQRAGMKIRLCRLEDEDDDDLSATTTLRERIAMMRPLALACWSVMGEPIVEYRRDEMPIKLARLTHHE